MANERKNEIWAMLSNELRRKLQLDYIKACEAQEFDPHNDRIYAHRMFMQKYFGKDNMEECKELNDYNLTGQAEEKCTNPTENVISDSKIHSESAESVETDTKEDAYCSDSFQSFTDWNKYRLDLAREIAVAIINTANKDARYGDTLPYVAVKIANEIVKRLKETEE